MKKYFVLILISVLFLTGCKKNLVCTKKYEENDYEVTSKVEFTKTKNNYVDTEIYTSTMSFKDEKSANYYYSILKSLGSDFTVSKGKNKVVLKSSKSYAKEKTLIKDMKKQMKENGYSCK